MAPIPAGSFVMGSTAEQREYGYRLDEARGSFAARRYGWFDNEVLTRPVLHAYWIDESPVTNAQYLRFVKATDHRVPFVDAATWHSYGLVHGYDEVQRFLWRDGAYPAGRGEHPVVLVSVDDARAYCHWRGALEDRALHLPTEAQWEKAARGPDGRVFPWGDEFDAAMLNSQDNGPYDTTPVTLNAEGASVYGVKHMAGMVFEWTETPCSGASDRTVVKGGSWDDFPGVTRGAARHCRPNALKHILVGFRCASQMVGVE